jgi:O-antigen ligase
MKSMKPPQWFGLLAGLALALYFVYTHLQYFHDVSFLGSILLLELIIASVWKFDQRFFIVLMTSFLWAGMNLPMQGVWTGGRWLVLGVGAVVGFIVWIKTPRKPFSGLHLVAFFCVCAAFVSATVSPFFQMASFKALSLLMLLLYCASGARLAMVGREDRFFRGLLLGSEIAVYGTAACYFGLHSSIWGNPNSLGAVMSIGLYPILLWGWLNADGPAAKARRLIALLLCTYLVFFSMARAGIISISIVTLIFCVGLRQYKLLVKVVALILLGMAVTGMVSPETLTRSLADMKDAMLYKGHKNEGMLGSRRSPWEKSIATIKEHPLFGTGYGTSPSGDDPGFGFGRFASSAETARENGSSYMTIAEWVGLLGVIPFIALLVITVSNVWKVCAWMNRTANLRHYSIPLAMVVFSGLIHANFEDWLFAVGSYLSVFFWVCAFLLTDLIPGGVVAPAARAVSRSPRQAHAGFGPGVPSPVMSNAASPRSALLNR